MDLSKYLDQPVTVKFAGGREGELNLILFHFFFFSLTQCIKVSGILKGYDGLVNLVIDECREYIQGKEKKKKEKKKKVNLGGGGD